MKDKLQQLETLVRSAAGIDDDRGDTVSVISRQFVAAPVPEIVPEEAWLDLSRADYMRFGELGLIGLISLMVILIGVKPALRRLLPEVPAAPKAELPTSVTLGQDGRPLLVHAPTEHADAVAAIVRDAIHEAAHYWSPEPEVRFVADISTIIRWSEAKS